MLSDLRRFPAAAIFVGLPLIFGCSEAASAEAPPAMKLKAENSGTSLPADDWSHVPVPPADGPSLAPLAMTVAVRARPASDAEVIGVLRVGARVARSAQAVSERDCAGGWYAVRPLGFVCAGPDATLKLDHPVARAIQVEPDRSKAMPYRYAFVRAIAPNYMRIPSAEEQSRYEMRLERHLKSWRKFKAEWDVLEVGANDVPLDERGLALGPTPEAPRPLSDGERFGGGSDDRVPWWLEGERRIPNLSSFKVPGYAVIGNRIKRHGGVALIGSFTAPAAAEGRRFAITTDARLIPADKLKPDSGSPFHGTQIKDIGLPVAFVRGRDARFARVPSAHAIEDGERLASRELIPLTGNVRMSGPTRLVESRDGRWLRSADLGTIAKPSSLPPWVKKTTKWIDISLANQTLTLWQGDVPVYATLVSSGRDGMGEPGKTLSTPQGIFKIFQKHVTATMDSDVSDHEFELRDVPWVMYFKGGYALHAAYWHDDFGRPRSHGCVNLAPIDARYVFLWSSPTVPEHWHATYTGEKTEPGTVINIHP